MTDYLLPPADLAFTAPPPAYTSTATIPAATLALTAPGPLLHNQILLTSRWRFYDPQLDETWELPLNPDSMASPLATKGLSFGRPTRAGGRHATIRAVPRPLDWEFAGVIRTQAHHDGLNDWAGRRRIIHLTDHVHRTFEVLLTDFQVTERTPTRTTTWRLRYTMKALLLRQIS